MLKIGNKIITFGQFADGSCHVDIDCSSLEPHAPIVWLYENDAELVHLWFLTQHCRDHEGYRRDLSIPFLCNSRMDRTKLPTDVFTLKYFSQMINALHFDRVETFDAHSDVAAALINHIHVISPINLIKEILEKLDDVIVCLPDEGSMLRYRGELLVPTIYGIKERNWQTQRVEQLVLCGATEEVKGKDILIIDDICGKGSTIYHMAKQLKELGANNIYVYVSHCENTVLNGNIQGRSLLDLPNLITKLYTTNSIFTLVHPKIKIIHYF